MWSLCTTETTNTDSPISAVPSATHSFPMAWTEIWELDFPLVAFSAPVVRTALCALSAIDLSTRCPKEPILLLAARSYFQKALTTHRQMVASHDDQSILETFLTAVLLVSSILHASNWPAEFSLMPANSQHCTRHVIPSLT